MDTTDNKNNSKGIGQNIGQNTVQDTSKGIGQDTSRDTSRGIGQEVKTDRANQKKIDPKTLIIYSEIMRPKFDE